MELSALNKARYAYNPKLPPVLTGELAAIEAKLGAPTESVADQASLKAQFAKNYGKPIVTFEKGKGNIKTDKVVKIGVILSGGQAPGGHNVITGLFDGLKKANAKNVLFGFQGGPAGIMKGKYIEITADFVNAYRNTGGFDMIGSGRDKIETEEQFAASLATATALGLTAVVVIGGDDSNTNAALLAEYFLANGSDIQVIGCPKTIDGDLKNEYIETSFGFDTACKTYSELIGNIGRDANSAKKYWHFIKLMGRSASHIGLECALQTHPNICLISEEVEAKKMSLGQVVEYVANIVAKRSEAGNNFGIALIPEGLVEFIPEIKGLIGELNHVLADGSESAAAFNKLASFEEKIAFLKSHLDKASVSALESLPKGIQGQLLLDRDPHGNVQVSLIETEKLLGELVKAKLDAWKKEGKFKGKFAFLPHFFGYEGRCAFPSNFDADYCYSLGFTAYLLVAGGFTGYLSSVRGLDKAASTWLAGGIPLTMMMNVEQRHGKAKPVIRKALVELDSPAFKEFASKRDTWAIETGYLFPGAIQYWGPAEVADQPTMTLALEGRAKK